MAKQESVSSESESEEEAEYHPNVSICQTQIPEEIEEEEEPKEEEHSSLPAVVLPAEETSQEVDESGTEDKKEGERGTDEPMVTPDASPSGPAQPDPPAEEEEEPRVNGEPRPQVICCSEVKSALGHLESFPQLSSLIQLETNLLFLPAFHRAGFPFLLV